MLNTEIWRRAWGGLEDAHLVVKKQRDERARLLD